MDIDHQISIYKTYSDDHHKYTTLIWQFPTVLIGLNILALEKLSHTRLFFLAMWVINLALVFSLAKHVFNQRRIVATLALIEIKLKESELITPDFQRRGFARIFDVKVTWLIVWVLLILNMGYLIAGVFPSLL